MSSSTPLDLLIEQSRKSRDQAGRTLAENRHTRQQAAQQLETLRQYRHEYSNRLHDALVAGMDAVSLDNYRQFIRSLETAIGKAGHHLEQRDREVVASQQHWQTQQKRLSSYDTLAQRRESRHQLAESRAEQRRNDEFSNTNQARRRVRADESR